MNKNNLTIIQIQSLNGILNAITPARTARNHRRNINPARRRSKQILMRRINDHMNPQDSLKP